MKFDCDWTFGRQSHKNKSPLPSKRCDGDEERERHRSPGAEPKPGALRPVRQRREVGSGDLIQRSLLFDRDSGGVTYLPVDSNFDVDQTGADQFARQRIEV